MKKLLFLGLLFLLFLMPMNGQQRWSAEFRPVLNFPTNDLGDNNLKVGYGFEAKIAYKMMPHLRAYGGWGWNEIKTETKFPQNNIIMTERGYNFGFELTLPISNDPLTYYLFGGGIFNHIEIENMNNNLKGDTDHGLGWQLGGGLEYTFAPKWNLRPEIRYHSLSRDIKMVNLPATIKLKYVAFGIGLLREF